MTSCIAKPIEAKQKESYCGSPIFSFDWHFQDADHAILALQKGMAVQPCSECLKAIKSTINQELGDD